MILSEVDADTVKRHLARKMKLTKKLAMRDVILDDNGLFMTGNPTKESMIVIQVGSPSTAKAAALETKKMLLKRKLGSAASHISLVEGLDFGAVDSLLRGFSGLLACLRAAAAHQSRKTNRPKSLSLSSFKSLKLLCHPLVSEARPKQKWIIRTSVQIQKSDGKKKWWLQGDSMDQLHIGAQLLGPEGSVD